MTELLSKVQGIKHSGVGGHHHSSVAKNIIDNTVCTDHVMMIHSALHWTEHNECDLWPHFLIHAAYLHYDTPRMLYRLSPTKLWSCRKLSHSDLINAHPRGFPVYVLQPRLQDGVKLPNWDTQSRRGHYMGVSPLHASTVRLVRNLNKNCMSPQFHVVYDNLLFVASTPTLLTLVLSLN